MHVADLSSGQTNSALRRPTTSMADELLYFEWLEASPPRCAASSFSQGSAVNKPEESLTLPDSAIDFQQNKGLFATQQKPPHCHSFKSCINAGKNGVSFFPPLSPNQLCSHSPLGRHGSVDSPAFVSLSLSSAWPATGQAKKYGTWEGGQDPHNADDSLLSYKQTST